MYRIILIGQIVLFLFLTTSLPAQKKEVDSLLRLFNKETSEIEKGRLGIKIAKEYISFDTVNAKSYLNKGLTLANKTNDDLARGMYHLYTAYIYCNKGAYDEGLKSFDRSSMFFNTFLKSERITNTEKTETEYLLLDAEYSRGSVLLEKYEYEKAVAIFWKVLNTIEHSSLPDKKILFASVYRSIALAYYHRAQYQPALEYYLKAGTYAKESGDTRMMAELNIYTAMCHTLLGSYSLSEELLIETEPLVSRLQDTQLKTNFYARKAELYRYTEKWQLAVENYDKAIQNAKVTFDVYMQSTFLNAKARCLLKLNRKTEAKLACLEGLTLAKSINKKKEILESQKILSLIESEIGNYDLAYKYLEEYTKGNDSLQTSELTNKINALNKKYQTELKEEKINQLEKDKLIQQALIKKKQTANYILIGSFAVLAIFSLLYYHNYKQKQKFQQQRINELETEKQLTATEAVLKGEAKERTRLAKDLHDGLGGMLSGIKYSLNTMKGNLILTPDNALAFERSLDMLDSTIKEMRRVAHDLMPENLLKFGLDTALKDFCSSINNSGVLLINYQSFGVENQHFEQTVSISAYRIIQELVNNILKHANAETALIQLTKSNKSLLIDVEDNGIGFDMSIIDNQKGIGWKNIQSRLEYLNGKLDLKSNPGKGTSIHIEIEI